MKNVTCRLYPNDRHEILNERNRREVFQDMLGWMESTGALNYTYIYLMGEFSVWTEAYSAFCQRWRT